MVVVAAQAIPGSSQSQSMNTYSITKIIEFSTVHFPNTAKSRPHIAELLIGTSSVRATISFSKQAYSFITVIHLIVRSRAET